jgi:hypothetical protein
MTPHLISITGSPGEFNSYIQKEGISTYYESFQFAGTGVTYIFYAKMDRQQAIALKLTVPYVRCMELPGN